MKYFKRNKSLVLLAGTAGILSACATQETQGSQGTYNTLQSADMIVTNAKVAVMDDKRTQAEAIAIKDGKVLRTGNDEDILRLKDVHTQVIDGHGRTLIPGLNDSHLHVTRGGRFYNTELRWDGVTSLKEALRMLKEQADRTPKGQWVRVIGGWSPYQFEEKRMPTIDEINEATGDAPAFVLYLYSRGWLNKAGIKTLNIDKNTQPPNNDSRYEKDKNGNPTGVLLAEPNAMILYQVIGKLPPLSEAEMINSTQHFNHELNRFGLTSAIASMQVAAVILSLKTMKHLRRWQLVATPHFEFLTTYSHRRLVKSIRPLRNGWQITPLQSMKILTMNMAMS